MPCMCVRLNGAAVQRYVTCIYFLFFLSCMYVFVLLITIFFISSEHGSTLCARFVTTAWLGGELMWELNNNMCVCVYIRSMCICVRVTKQCTMSVFAHCRKAKNWRDSTAVCTCVYIYKYNCSEQYITSSCVTILLSVHAYTHTYIYVCMRAQSNTFNRFVVFRVKGLTLTKTDDLLVINSIAQHATCSILYISILNRAIPF